jgi:hypothetical protein
MRIQGRCGHLYNFVHIGLLILTTQRMLKGQDTTRSERPTMRHIHVSVSVGRRGKVSLANGARVRPARLSYGSRCVVASEVVC